MSVAPDGDAGVDVIAGFGAVVMLLPCDSGGGKGTSFSADSAEGGHGTAVVPLVTAATETAF